MGRKLLLEASSPAIPSSSSNSTNHKMRPGVLLLIVILAIIFFLSGLLYLILRCLPRPSTREEEVTDNATSLQRQLQHLFHLQDSGIDQSYIDSLPIFVYKSITGLKNPFDCAVCLCEFQPDDKLRLLPRCAHAFHLECIDTWLLSHSTCPLCRGSLLHLDCSSNCFSPLLHVLESRNENSREPVPEDREASSAASNNTQLSVAGEEENRSNNTSIVDMTTRVVPVKLGKFRNVNGAAIAEGSSSSSSNAVDSMRRCRSMGSCEYVVDNSSLLNVVIKSSAKKHSNGSRCQHPYSEQPCQSIRGLDEFEEIDLEGGNSSIAQVKQVERNGTSVTKTWRSLSLKLPLRSVDEDASKGPFPPVVGTKGWVSYSWNWRTG